MKEDLSILDALENLNTLVDADSLDEIEVTQGSLLIPHKGEIEGGKDEIYWVQAGPDDQTRVAIQNTFSSVHSHLQTFYSKMKKDGDTKRLMEGINAVMVLVGEAAKKMEKFGTLFRKRVTEFEEYEKLQDFYRNRVIKESFREFAKTSLPKGEIKSAGQVLPEQMIADQQLQELLAEEPVEEFAGIHILNDIDVIKRDHLYELFFLKNEAGHHFFTYELARTIKLSCDFGEYAGGYFGEDPLLQIKNWEDKELNLRANAILKNCKRLIDQFYKGAMRYKEMEVATSVHNAVMALMLAANPRNLIRQFALKGCHLYFHDFLYFLRATMKNREYQKFMIYGAPLGKPFFQDLLDLVDSLCYQLFTAPIADEEVSTSLKQMINEGRHSKGESLSHYLAGAYRALNAVLQKHPNGPVFKALDLIREEEIPLFDPIFLGNIPCQEWRFVGKDQEAIILRMPCPIQQEVIDRAFITPEFETFLHGLKARQRLLYINFQDRTSWKEHARSVAMEELARQAQFAENLTVVTLAKDTEFYNQAGYYQDSDDAHLFIQSFSEHLHDETTGYYFPPELKKELFPEFIQKLLGQIHITFFEGKKSLGFIERLDFIELTYIFLELKLVELVHPAFVAFGSKDGLDISGTTSAGLISVLSIGKNKKWSGEELDRFSTILFAPTLKNRERIVHPERFERLLSVVELLEKNVNYLMDFATLYTDGSLNLKCKLEKSS